MTLLFNKIKTALITTCILLLALQVYAQADTNEWKMQLAFGINNPFNSKQNEGFTSKKINFPTINLGVQHMFSQKLGAKLDFGYNRASNDDNSPDFKFNYTRVNAQLVYDLTNDLSFMIPQGFALVSHLGPGISFTKPLANYSNNKHTFINAMAGLELHYGISETLSVYGDVSYVLALSQKDKYNPAIDGFSFNGNLLTATIGVSVSLSGCRYCD